MKSSRPLIYTLSRALKRQLEPKNMQRTALTLAAFLCLAFTEARGDFSYDMWKYNYFLDPLDPNEAGPNADPDGDGYANLMEYTFATNPMSGLSKPTVATGITDGNLTLSYSTSSVASGTILVPLASDDLQTWRTGPLQFSLSTVWAGAQKNFVAVDASPSGSNTRFFKVAVVDVNQDTDHDGMPDGYELLFGLNPNVNDAFLDSDGDGVSNVSEYHEGSDPSTSDAPPSTGGGSDGYSGGFGTDGSGDPAGSPTPPTPVNSNPYNSDYDEDGLVNTFDDYPHDGARKRTENIGLRHYGLLDLTRYAGGELAGVFSDSGIPGPVKDIAVDDTHRVAWFTREPHYGPNNIITGYTTRAWGWFSHKIRLTLDIPDQHPTNSELVQSWVPADIHPSGTLVGTYVESTFSESKARGFVIGRGGQTLIMPPGGDNPKLDTALFGIAPSANRLLWGMGTTELTQDEIAPVPFAFTSWASPGGFATKVVRADGSALGEYSRYNAIEPNPLVVWKPNGRVPVPRSMNVYDLNASNEVVGEHIPETVFIEERGAVWKLDASDVENFHDKWIPPVVRNQFQDSIPALINDRHEIIFQSNLLEGGGPGKWRNHFFWISETAKTTKRSYDVAMCVFGDDVAETVKIKRQNQVGTLGVICQGKPALAIPCEFTSSDISKGFDYPLFDDPPYSALDGDQPEDQDRPEWWTVATRTNATGADMNVSNHVSLEFASDEAARLFKATVALESLGKLELASGTISGRKTPLSVKALPNPNVADETVEYIDVLTKQAGVPQPIRNLRVSILPEVYRPVRICFVHDPRRGPDQAGLNPTRCPDLLRIPDIIVNRLNTTFRQAGVRFYIHSASGPVGVPFDNNGDNSLGGTLMENSDEALAFGAPGLFNRNMLTMFVVGSFPDGINSSGGLARDENRQPLPWVFINGNSFLNEDQTTADSEFYFKTCCHEIGHALGIATWQFVGDPTNAINSMHDWGKRPRRYGNVFPLMHPGNSGVRPGDFWIRHEDWIAANKKARTLAQ